MAKDKSQSDKQQDNLPGAEELFRLMVESVTDYAIFATDIEGSVVSWNTGAERIFGYAEEEIVGHDASVIFTPEDIEQRQAELELETAASQGRAEDERWHVRKDGSRFWASGIMTPLRDEAGNLRGFVKVARDNTRRQLDEEHLRISETLSTALIEQSPFSIQILSPQGQTLRVNRAWEELWGVTLDQIADYNMLDDQQLVARGVMPYIRKGFAGEAAAIPPIMYDPNETIPDRSSHREPQRWVRAFIYPVKDERGNVREVVLMHEDITEHKRAEDALRESEESHRVIAETASDAIITVSEDSTILFVNMAAEQIFGYTSEEMLGQQLTMLMPEYLRHLHRAGMQRYIETGNKHISWEAMELPGLHKSGHEIPLELSFGEFTRDGKHVFTGIARDISGRRQAEEERNQLLKREQAARAEAERQRDFTHLVLEHAPIAIGVMEGPDHRFVLVNQYTCDLTGLSEDQFIGRPHAEVVPEADKVVGPILDRVYTTGISETEEVEVGLPKGRRQLLVTWTALPGQDGSPGSVLYLSLDITDRKHAEAALKESTEQYRATFEKAAVGIGHTAPDGRWLRVNQKLCDIVGYTREEMLGLTYRDITHPDNLEADIMAVREMLSGELQTYTTEKRYLHKNGSEVWINLTVSPLRDPSGGLKYFISVIEDVTGRKRAEEALRESERQLRTLADAVPQLVWMAEPDGHIFWYNQRWYDYTGTTPEQMEGWGWQSVHDSEMLPRVVERWKASLETGEPFEMEFPLKGADGVFRWFLTRVNPLRDSQGRILRWFGTNTDVDEQRRTAEELREANRLKDEFLATVSHELRTPLTAVLGWAYLLRSEQLDEKAAAGALETIERNARSQAQLIDDLLDVSRIITGKLRLDVRQVDPGSFIESAIESLRPAAEAKGVRVQKVMDTGVNTIAGDAARLQQVVWNLLSNAIKFTPKGGRVQVRLERVNSHIEIVVIDTGAGIPAEFLPHVFDRFRQADQSTTRNYGGLGLGLAIVRHLVELHGGTVHAESPGEGHGATFTVKLPVIPIYNRDDLAERAHPAARETLPSFGCPERLDGVKVLVIDDEADARELLRVGLGQCGAEVTTAGSAREALEAVKEARPDVLISDIGMPEEDGYALIKQIRALTAKAGGKIPAIALTAYARTEDRLQALRAGYQMHVTKPVEITELVAVVASLVQRNS